MSKNAIIQDEITNDPLAAGYAAMSDKQVAESLNSKVRSKYIPIDSNELLAWSVYEGRLARIRDGINNGIDNIERSLCEACHILISRDSADLDLNEQSRVDMLNALVSYGRLTDQERQGLYDKATVSVSRAEELGIGKVRPGDVQRARS